MKTEEEIQALIAKLKKNEISVKISKSYNMYDLMDILEWVLQPTLDGEEIIEQELNTTIKRKDLTCYTCFSYPSCDFRDDIYNTDGDCLGNK